MGGHPVLAVPAVQVAAQHAEAVSQGARPHVEEGLFLDGVALGAGDVSPGDAQLSPGVESNFADPRLPLEDGAAVAASSAADAPAVQRLPQLPLAGVFSQDPGQSGHLTP